MVNKYRSNQAGKCTATDPYAPKAGHAPTPGSEELSGTEIPIASIADDIE